MPCRYNAELSDPRPQKYRDNYGYYNHANNIVTIFCASSQLDLSFKFIVPNAFNNFTMLETVKKKWHNKNYFDNVIILKKWSKCLFEN